MIIVNIKETKMSENTKKTQIVLDDITYYFEDMTTEQQMFVNHINDLERKIAGASFSLDQLQVGKQAFVQMLKQSLETKEETIQQ